MRKFGTLAVMAVVFCALSGSAAMAGWKTCMGCHNGAMALNRESLKEKFPSAEHFVKAAKESPSPLMKSVQQDEQALRDAAREIGLE